MVLQRLYAIGLLLVGLTACGAETAPTSLPPAGDSGAPQPTSEPFVIVTRQPQPTEENPLDDILAGVPIGPTLVSSATEDPDRALVFDLVELTIWGGPEGRLELVLRQDGTYVRNGTPGRVPPSVVTVVDDALDAINFFGLNGIYSSLNAENPARRYSLRVVRANLDRRIDGEEGYIPREFLMLMGQIATIGAN